MDSDGDDTTQKIVRVRIRTKQALDGQRSLIEYSVPDIISMEELLKRVRCFSCSHAHA